MKSGSHIIGKQHLEIRIAGGMDGFALQEEISRILQGPALRAIEELFNRTVGEDEIVRLDRVDIDLGRLDHSRLEDELVENLVEAFEGVLQEQAGYDHRDRRPSNEARLSPSRRVFELWYYYLKHGYFPWWASGSDHETFETDVLEVLEQPQFAREARRALKSSPRVRRRLVLQFGDEFLGSVVNTYVPDVGSAVSRFVKAISVDRGRGGGRGHTTVELLRDTIWQETMDAVFAQASSARRPALPEIAAGAARRMTDGAADLHAIPADGDDVGRLVAHLLETLERHEANRRNAGREQLPDQQPPGADQDFDPAAGGRADEKSSLQDSASDTDPSTREPGDRQSTDRPPDAERADSPSTDASTKSSRTAPDEEAAGRRVNGPADRKNSGRGGDRGESNSLQADSESESELAAGYHEREEISSDSGAGSAGSGPSPPFPASADTNENKPADPGPDERTAGEDEAIYLTNAGAVLLHPFLPVHFEACGFAAEDAFIDSRARERAIHQLHYLATGQTAAPEYAVTLAKILCGYPPGDPIRRRLDIDDEMQAEGNRLLEDVITHWEALKNTSPDGLREGFLQRGGKITRTVDGWKLQVERKSIDILISRMPWPLSLVKLPWMSDVLHVEWV